MAIAKAKTLNEVERLNQMLKTGVIPGKELKKLRGKCNWDKSDHKRFGIKKKSKCTVWLLNITTESRNY